MKNPAAMMKLMNAGKQFQSNHPKFTAFMNVIMSSGMPEGTVIEITVTKPNEEPITSNLKIMQSDLEMLEMMKELGNNQ